MKAGLSQEKLAERANLARNYIGNIERAEYKVTVETLAQIAKALGVRVRDRSKTSEISPRFAQKQPVDARRGCNFHQPMRSVRA